MIKKVVYILLLVSLLIGCKSISSKTEVESVDLVEQGQVEKKDIFIKDSSDYTHKFLNDLNQDGIEVTQLIDSFYIIGKEDTVQFPQQPRYGVAQDFFGKSEDLEVSLRIARKTQNSIFYFLLMKSLKEERFYKKKGTAEFGPFFYNGMESDVNFETGNAYFSVEYFDDTETCFTRIRIGEDDDTGEVLCKFTKNCNDKIQDITLDNFPNLRLKKD